MLGLHPDWGLIGPSRHGEHRNWARKRKRDTVRAASRVKGISWHISRRALPGGDRIIDVETQCGHVRLNYKCVSPEDYRNERVPPEEVCGSCRTELETRREER